MTSRVVKSPAQAAGVALGRLVTAARVLVTGGFLAFGLWSALPALSEIELPSPLALPTAAALPQPAATATSSVATVQAALTRAQQTGRSVPISISLADQDLTRAAEPYFPRTYAGVTVSSPQVRVVPGQIVLTATARSFLGGGPLTATATPYASDGRLVVRVDSATVGAMTLPDGMRAQIAQQLQAAIDAMTGSRTQITSVTAGQGTLTLKGLALP